MMIYIVLCFSCLLDVGAMTRVGEGKGVITFL